MDKTKISKAEELVNQLKFKMENPISQDIAMHVEDLLNLDLSEYIKVFTNTKLDSVLIEGFNPRSINIFAGRTGSGKSLALFHLAYRFSITNDSVCYISFENDIYNDAERMQELSKTYIEKGNFDYYNYLELEALGYGVDRKSIVELFKNYKYVFLDAYQLLTDDLEDGASMHATGNVLMKELHKISLKYGITFFLSWQLTRGAPTDIKEIEVDDMSFSIGVARYASSVWAISKEQSEKSENVLWRIRLIKSRAKYNDNKTIISMYNKNNNCVCLTNEEELA